MLRAFFIGGFGGDLIESFDPDRALPKERVDIDGAKGIDLSDYQV